MIGEDCVENTKKTNVVAAYLYISIPIGIFLATWLRWYIALPAVLLFVFGLFMMIKEAPSVWCPQKNHTTKRNAIISIAIVFFIVYLSGVGMLSYQNPDHYCRNSIFEALCDNSWPVYAVSNNGNDVSLVYYISFWLPSAIGGKFFGKTAGYCCMALWTVLGIAIFYSLFCSFVKKFKVWPLVTFFSFSGLDILLWFLIGKGEPNVSHIEWSVFAFQYSSFTTQLFWVFNQAVPAWIITMLLLLQKNNRNIVFLISLTLLNSPIPFIGILPIVVFLVFNRKYDGADNRVKWWQHWFKDTFTLQNILAGGSTGILSFLYIFSSPRSKDLDAAPLFSFVGNDFNGTKTFIMNYLLFIIFEILIYFVIIYPYYKKQPIFYVIGATLLVVPLIKMGNSIDFCMRASIPSLVLLYIFVTESLQRSFKEKKRIILIPLAIALIIGARTPVNEVIRTIRNTCSGVKNAGSFDLMKDETQINFVARTDNSVFFEYLAKK